ncbi:DNA polymerase-3 subunit beta [Mesorhizobium albiziae]|uniref:Beta sliding clamp n=1 Tax=Neomesorhizobium albiziae TaxID=335020 RepID=A0A1I4BKL5_9HYPH|nr:DNA polymerase III subunit beta [Mesorhizobium albiziae]GLS29923.1 DNA polymerase III subunit beta [Mesorhizobium albiziae]SFK68900.1 DNA polymerase-3 subunit beta [Mesorhizobium albiziae]
MTLALDPKILAAVHSALKSIPDRRNVIPVCGMYHLEAGDAGIIVTATDCDIEASLTVECAAEFAPVCVPPFLIEASGGLAGAEVKIAIDERQAVATSGRARFAAPVLPGEDFPKFRPSFDSRVEIGGGDLAGIIEAAVTAAAFSEARYYLEGVFLRTEGGRLHAVATDGHRLHTTSIVAPQGMALNTGIIIPTKAANEIARLSRKAAGNTVVLETCERAIAITAGGERVASKLIDGTFPDWRRVVPAPGDIAATFDLTEMLAALDRVMKIQAINEAATKAKNKAGAVRISDDGEFLTITAAGTDNAEAHDAVRAEFTGSFGVRGVSAKYLSATLGAMKERGADTATINSPDGGSPMRIESPTDEDFLAVVMPMRV